MSSQKYVWYTTRPTLVWVNTLIITAVHILVKYFTYNTDEYCSLHTLKKFKLSYTDMIKLSIQ